MACNGVIHTADRLLIPADTDIAELLRTQSDLSVLNRLIDVLPLILIRHSFQKQPSSAGTVRKTMIEFDSHRKMT